MPSHRGWCRTRAERERLGLKRPPPAGPGRGGRRQLAAAEQRAVWRGKPRFYEKSFRLGESDLPTRLRIDSEAFENGALAGQSAWRAWLAQGIFVNGARV